MDYDPSGSYTTNLCLLKFSHLKPLHFVHYLTCHVLFLRTSMFHLRLGGTRCSAGRLSALSSYLQHCTEKLLAERDADLSEPGLTAWQITAVNDYCDMQVKITKLYRFLLSIAYILVLLPLQTSCNFTLNKTPY